jgi:hypothetical protein
MDLLGGIFILLFLVIIIYPNFIFYKELKNIRKNHFKHKLFYFIISIIFPCSIVFTIAIIIASQFFDEMFDIKIGMNNYIFRLIYGCIIFPSGIFANVYAGKLYLKRITSKKNEIELIGKE